MIAEETNSAVNGKASMRSRGWMMDAAADGNVSSADTRPRLEQRVTDRLFVVNCALPSCRGTLIRELKVDSRRDGAV